VTVVPPEPDVAAAKALASLERSSARLACVQALYQIEMSGQPVETVIAEFADHRMGREIDGEQYAEPDRRHFERTVRAAASQAEALDTMVAESLSQRWSLNRIGTVMRALMRAATCELATCPDVPARVVINEYVELARAFFSGDEPAFVNGALDSIARRVRQDEMAHGKDDGPAAPRR
jgi:N utilization substance protein B